MLKQGLMRRILPRKTGGKAITRQGDDGIAPIAKMVDLYVKASPELKEAARRLLDR